MSTQLPEKQSKGRLVIGIDTGTTRSCIATAVVLYPNQESLRSGDQQKYPEIEVFCDYIGYNDNGNKCPTTTLYYTSPHQLPITGHELELLLKNPDPKSLLVNRLFRLWKIMFHNPNDPVTRTIQEKIQCQLDSIGKTSRSLLRDWVEILYRDLISDDEDNPSKLKYSIPDFERLDIEIVVPVPPGRSAIAHSQVLDAFVQSPISRSQVSLVSEPEALFRAWVHEEKNIDWEVGQRYLVLDAGGGTGCLVRFRLIGVDPIRFEQEFESESIICGAETISNEFDRIAAAKIPRNRPNKEWVLSQMRRDFETYKHIFRGARQGTEVPCVIQIPGTGDLIEFSVEEIASCFSQCVSRLVGGIKRQLVQGEKVDCLILGGGLCHNHFVRTTIRNEFASSLKIRHLTAKKDHVAKGGVLTRLYGPFIQKRPIKLSKGILTLLDVTPAIRQSNEYEHLDKYYDRDERKEMFYAIEWLARKGLQADDVYELPSESSYEGARRRTFPLNATYEDLNFKDTIYSVDFDPGNVEYTAIKRDGKLIDRQGQELPDIVAQQKMAWNPKDMGVNIAGLHTKMVGGGKCRRVLKYKFQMRIREVGTTSWIKAWSLNGKKGSTAEEVISELYTSESLFDREELSTGLERSFLLGDGIEKVAGHHRPLQSSKVVAPVLPTATRSFGNQVRNATTPISQPCLMEIARAPPTNEGTQLNSTSKSTLHSVDFSSGQKITPASSNRSVVPGSSTRGQVPYSRPNKGCYNCLLRHRSCSKETPVCSKCTDVGIASECTYVTPDWWHGDHLKKRQKEIHSELIRENKKRRKRQRVTETSPPAAAQPSVQNGTNLIHPFQVQNDSQQRNIPYPANKRSKISSSPQNYLDGDQGLYSASPSPREHMFEESDTITVEPTVSESRQPPLPPASVQQKTGDFKPAVNVVNWDNWDWETLEGLGPVTA